MRVCHSAGYPAGETSPDAGPESSKVREHPALLACGRSPSDAHHLRFAQQRALGRKVSDEFTVPLCRLHHRELHQRGDERTWWQQLKIDPLDTAQRLWRATHQDSEAQASVADGEEL